MSVHEYLHSGLKMTTRNGLKSGKVKLLKEFKPKTPSKSKLYYSLINAGPNTGRQIEDFAATNCFI